MLWCNHMYVCLLDFIHPNVGKTFVVFISSVWKALKKAIGRLNICWESFRGLLKIYETIKNFSRLTFIINGIWINDLNLIIIITLQDNNFKYIAKLYAINVNGCASSVPKKLWVCKKHLLMMSQRCFLVFACISLWFLSNTYM